MNFFGNCFIFFANYVFLFGFFLTNFLLFFLFLFFFIFEFFKFFFEMLYDCVQVNMNKAVNALTQLTNNLLNVNTIAFVTEPYTAYNRICSIPFNFSVFPQNSLSARPRAGIIVPSAFPAVEVGHLCNEDCSVLILNQDTNPILLASVYLDRNSIPTIPEWLKAIPAYADSKQYPLLLAFDSNCHSDLFGDNTNRRGEDFETFIVQFNLFVENIGISPTFETFRGNRWMYSNVDVTLSRGLRVVDWEVDRNYNGSDHNTIRYKIELDSLPLKEFRPWAKARWSIFTSTLNKEYKIPDVVNLKKIDRMVDYLYKSINEALDLACPKQVLEPKLKSHWFNDTARNLQTKVTKSYLKARRSKSVNDSRKFQFINKRFKNKCRYLKTKAWRDFVSGTANEHKMARLCRILQHKQKNKINILRKPDGDMTVPGLDTLEELARVHFPRASTFIPHQRYSAEPSASKELIQQKFDFINVGLVKDSLLRFKPEKAPGPDGLKPFIFRHIHCKLWEFLSFIYKCYLHFHCTPLLWRLTNVVFIPKPGKDTYLSAKSYRPICLSDYFLKGLERLIVWRVEYHLSNFPIHSKQHGFQKGKGTENALSIVVDYIEEFLFKKQHCLAIFLDISSAYDSISIDQIRSSLYRHGVEEDVVEWYYHYLSNRVLQLGLHGDSLKLHHFTGFPQGGAASALFWTIAFNPAIEIINGDDINGNGYADDCVALLGGTHIDQLVPRMQTMLDLLVAWGLSCGLHFNPQKTVAMVFSRSLKEFDSHLIINAREIPYSASARYLGVILDRRLHWNLHMLDKIKKAKAFLMKISNVTREIWGPLPHLMRWAYTCVVRPMIIFGCLVWAPALTKGYIEKFRRINRMAMNTYAPFPRSSPTRLVEILTDTFPLDLYVKKEGLCAYIRLRENLPLTWTGVDNTVLTHNISHRKFWITLKEDLDLEDITSIPSDVCDFRPSIHGDVFVNLESFEGGDNYLEMTDINVFTDGSKSDFGVGSAFRILRGDELYKEESFTLPSYSTVFQAEVHAILKAAQGLVLLPGDLRMKFFVDSQAALRALCAREVHSKLVKAALQNLYELINVKEFVWIKSHSGNEHNDAVDQLAKDASLSALPGENICPSKNFVRNLVLEKLRLCWDDQWREYPEARQSKIFYSNQDPRRAKEACKLSRKKLSRLIRIVTGHNGLLYHRHNIENSIDPTCRYCESDFESFSHFLLECSSFDRDRQEIFQQRDLFGTIDWKIEELLKFSFLPRIHDALTWKNDVATADRAEVVIHPFSDSDSDADDVDTHVNTQDISNSDNTDYDSDYNEGEDLLDNDLDLVFQ